ncbi:MAG: SDR family NAD(P)-dependent oxidoreductase, partial [Caldilineaceae bacterium]|nr:SDR family NAD(P)-dependent oxidoreductase [Caldilineaceae bacterium]
MKRLEGKNVLVTGASSGIGRAVALACAKEGANVAVCARRADRLEEVATQIRELGVKAAICVADVGVEAEILAALSSAQEALGPIDVLVNNAGILLPDELESLDLDTVTQQMEVNALGPLRVTQHLLGNLEKGSKVALVTSRMGSIADNGSGRMYGYRMS